MFQTKEEFLKTRDAANLMAAWQNAADKIESETTPTKAPLFGVNFRVNLLKALQATWETAEVTMTAIVTGSAQVFDPVVWIGIGVEAISAVRSVVSSLVQQMQPIDYISYVILSRTPEGIEEISLKEFVETFLTNPSSMKFAWYLGMNEGRVEQAKEVIEAPDWFDDVMGRLAKNKMVGRKGTLVIFQPRNFTIGWESE